MNRGSTVNMINKFTKLFYEQSSSIEGELTVSFGYLDTGKQGITRSMKRPHTQVRCRNCEVFNYVVMHL
jgi:hypothetical protein